MPARVSAAVWAAARDGSEMTTSAAIATRQARNMALSLDMAGMRRRESTIGSPDSDPAEKPVPEGVRGGGACRDRLRDGDARRPDLGRFIREAARVAQPSADGLIVADPMSERGVQGLAGGRGRAKRVARLHLGCRAQPGQEPIAIVAARLARRASRRVREDGLKVARIFLRAEQSSREQRADDDGGLRDVDAVIESR